MHNYSALLFAAVALLLAGPMQTAQAQKPAGKPAKRYVPLTSSKDQVDGIISRTVDNLWDYTDHYFHDGDYNRVISLCRVIVECDPSFDDAYENAAYLLWSQDDAKGADDFLSYGLKHSKDQLSLLFEFGSHLMRTKRPEAALPYLEKASKFSNADARVYVELGHCYEKNKRYDDAVKTLETLVKKFPSFPSGKKLLKDARQLAATGKK